VLWRIVYARRESRKILADGLGWGDMTYYNLTEKDIFIWPLLVSLNLEVNLKVNAFIRRRHPKAAPQTLMLQDYFGGKPDLIVRESKSRL
jgi:hypothetical protein